MNSRSLIVTFLLALASLGLSPLAAQTTQPTTPASPFEARVASAKAAMMGDPEAALRHARAATVLSRNNPNTRARLIEEATGYWLEGEALIRVNRPQEAGPVIDRGMAIASRYAARTKLHADLLKARA